MFVNFTYQAMSDNSIYSKILVHGSMESCKALIRFRCTILVGSTGKALKTITFLGFSQPWKLAAAVGNAIINAVLYGIYKKNCH